MSEPIQVNAEKPYAVFIEPGALDRLPDAVGGCDRVAILYAPTLEAVASKAAGDLTCAVTMIELPDAEAAKTADVVAECWNRLAADGFTRSDAVVGLGGGATTDLAGFVAATWLRGVRYVSVPTTVLAMVDAGVGGKTGINLDAGKNLVGAFWEPYAVLCDLSLLQTLPLDDLRAGLGESIKCGFIADPEILTLVEQNPDACLDATSPVLAEVIRRGIQVKADVVSGDLRERTSTDRVGRELLNYGHTFGHAIENREHYAWRHGEAISVGMVFVAELACLAGKLDRATVDRHRSVLELVGLPTSYQPDAWPELRRAMSLDKKARGSVLRFVVLNGLASAEIMVGPDEDLLEQAYAAVSR